MVISCTEEVQVRLLTMALIMTKTDKKEECSECFGRGFYCEMIPETEHLYIPDYNEVYCDCPRGVILRKKDGG